MASMTINAANYPALKSGERVSRKYYAHAIDASFGSSTPDWYRLGDDLDNFSVDLNPDTENNKNILGNTSFRHNGYEPSASAEPFYAKAGDKLFERLQHIIDTLATGDECKTTALEVHLWKKDSAKYEATTQECYVVPTSYGGDTSGVQIPFDVNYIGDKTIGAFDSSTGAFSRGTWAQSYTAVSTPTGNPSTQGYYERSGSEGAYVYTLSTDTTVDNEKTYYTAGYTFTAAT